MRFRLHFPTLFFSIRAASEVARASYWGHCAHCDTMTPWTVNALRGEYRCTACRKSTIEG